VADKDLRFQVPAQRRPLIFLIKIKLLKIGAPINSGRGSPPESPASISTPSPDETPEVGVRISQIKYGFQ
jgi:hypothetical protein